MTITCTRTVAPAGLAPAALALSLVTAADWNLMISIERYLKLSFERRNLPGPKARFSGPKKPKASGRAAGSKKKAPKPATAKSKSRQRNQKMSASRRPGRSASRSSA